MPTVTQDPRALPGLEWLTHPQSVMEPGWHGPVRSLVHALGLDDPTQVLAVGVPLEVGPMGGGAIAAAAAKFPRFARALQIVKDAPGFFSRVDEAAAGLPAVAAPAKVASVLKQAASGEEILARGVPQWLEAQGSKVTREAVQAHLADHPVPPIAIKTLGGPKVRPSADLPAGYRIEPLAAGNRPGAQHNYTLVGPDGAGSAFYATDTGDAADMAHEMLIDRGVLNPAGGRATKFSNYQLPGGENYRETLITLAPERQWIDGSPITAEDLSTQFGRENADRVGSYRGDVFTSSHFDEPNILAHVRSNEREIPGIGRGRFLEEVQSDWHQKGKAKGYGELPATPGPVAHADLRLHEGPDSWTVTTTDGRKVEVGKGTVSDEAEARSYAKQYFNNRAEELARTRRIAQEGRVPDAPFKTTWPDLALKQQLLETAADPTATWIGHTSGATQAARYDLAKHVDGIKAYRRPDGKFDFMMKPRGAAGFSHNVDAISEAQLADNVGKDLAHKIVGQADGWHTYTGVDLQVGGEGMKYFYDTLLPKRLEKIVKPFGGTVERAQIGGRTKATIDAEMDAVMAEGMSATDFGRDAVERYNALQAERNASTDGAAAWIVRLTPEMKARILHDGLSLLGVGGLAVAGAPFAPADPDSAHSTANPMP